MHTLFEGFWEHACRVLLPFSRQAVGTRCLCGGRVENEGWDTEENVSISHGLVGGSDDRCVNSLLSLWQNLPIHRTSGRHSLKLEVHCPRFRLVFQAY